MLVTKERSLYRMLCKESKETIKESFQAGVPPLFSCLPPMSHSITTHLSFDMAQQYTDDE